MNIKISKIHIRKRIPKTELPNVAPESMEKIVKGKYYHICRKNQKIFLKFLRFFLVSSNFDLSGLLSPLEKNHWRPSLENKNFMRSNVRPFKSTRNKILSKNWSKYHLQFFQLSLYPESLWGHAIVPPGENISQK